MKKSLRSRRLFNPAIRCMMILTIAPILIAGCSGKDMPKGKDTKTQKTDGSTTDMVKHKVMSFNLEGLTDKGAKKWDVTGLSAEAISASEIKLNKIVARSYGKDGEAVITGDEGIYDKTKNNVRLEKNVKAVIENTQQFAADFADTSALQSLDQSSPPDPGLDRKAADFNQVAASPKSKEKAKSERSKTKTVITCDGAVQFDYEINQGYFIDNVKITNDDGNIDADKITVNLDPTTKKVSEILAEGNVKITREGNITYSEKATYVEAEKKILLTGRPRILIYNEGGVDGKFLGK